MKKSMKLLLVAVLVLPMMFMLSACGSTAEQVYFERVPMISIPDGKYEMVYFMERGIEFEIEDGIMIDEKSYYDGLKISIEVMGNVILQKQTYFDFDKWGDDKYIVWNEDESEGVSITRMVTYLADAFGLITFDDGGHGAVWTYTNGRITLSYAYAEDGYYGVGVFQLVE